MNPAHPIPDEDDDATLDDRLLDAMLHHIYRPDVVEQELRVQRLLDTISLAETEQTPRVTDLEPAAGASKAPMPAPTDRQPKRTSPFRLLAKSMTAVLTVTLVIVLTFGFLLPGPQSADAAVARSVAWIQQQQPREYQYEAQWHSANGAVRTVTGELYVAGPTRFVLRYPSFAGAVWVGGNEREKWLVPPIGPILVGSEADLNHWLVNRQQLTTPYLHLTSVLQRMGDSYELTMLSKEDWHELPNSTQPATVLHIRGELRPEKSNRLPRVVELWADPESGIARRMQLRWETTPQAEILLITFSLLREPSLPVDWFEHTGHNTGRRILTP